MERGAAVGVSHVRNALRFGRDSIGAPRGAQEAQRRPLRPGSPMRQVQAGACVRGG